MCRSIKTLRGSDELTDADIHAAALQFIRKVSGYRTPSPANQEVFEAAVAEVQATTGRLLGGLRPGARSERRTPEADRRTRAAR